MTLLRALVTAITLTAGEERCLSEWMLRVRIATYSSQDKTAASVVVASITAPLQSVGLPARLVVCIEA